MTSNLLPVYAAYCDYFATGEGRTVIVALGSTPELAICLFKERAPPYFALGIEIIRVGEMPRSEAVERWLPKELQARLEHGPISFFGIFHQNLS